MGGDERDETNSHVNNSRWLYDYRVGRVRVKFNLITLNESLADGRHPRLAGSLELLSAKFDILELSQKAEFPSHN